MTEALFELRNLHIYKKEDGSELVGGLDITLFPGECLGLCGESGSGKTVTLKSIIGLLPESLCAVYDRKTASVRTAMIFQDPLSALDPLYPVGKQIAEVYMARHGASGCGSISGASKGGRSARGKLREEAYAWGRKLLPELGLPAGLMDEKRLPHTLSGGQCQRICTAIALACEPELLLCDEPVTALDVTIRGRMLELLKKLSREKGFAVIFVTHDLAAASMICDRIMIMKQGQVIEEGTPGSILGAPEQEYTRKLVRSILTV